MCRLARRSSSESSWKDSDDAEIVVKGSPFPQIQHNGTQLLVARLLLPTPFMDRMVRAELPTRVYHGELFVVACYRFYSKDGFRLASLRINPGASKPMSGFGEILDSFNEDC